MWLRLGRFPGNDFGLYMFRFGRRRGRGFLHDRTMGRFHARWLRGDERNGDRIALGFLWSRELVCKKQDGTDQHRMHAGGQGPAVPIGWSRYRTVDGSPHYRTLAVCQEIWLIMKPIINIGQVYTRIRALKHVQSPDKHVRLPDIRARSCHRAMPCFVAPST